MKAKVIKCDVWTFWYSDRIGETFEVEQDPGYDDKWRVIGDPDSSGTSGMCMLDKDDCEILATDKISNKIFEVVNDDGLGMELQVRNAEEFRSGYMLDPLKVSIKKWKLIAEAVMIGNGFVRDGGVNTCALCKRYYTGNGSTCEECPVFKVTGKKVCNGSPYQKYAGLTHDTTFAAVNPLEAYTYAAQEYFFLKSLKNT
jgi:hypothetical protein